MAARLEEQGIITDARVFEEYVEHKDGLTLPPGNYTLSPRDDMGNIQVVCRRRPTRPSNVTFIEGWTPWPMDARLNEKRPRSRRAGSWRPPRPAIRTSCPPTHPSRGPAFPDTYQIGGDESADSVGAW